MSVMLQLTVMRPLKTVTVVNCVITPSRVKFVPVKLFSPIFSFSATCLDSLLMNLN